MWSPGAAFSKSRSTFGPGVFFGGGSGAKQAWIENDFDQLEQFEVIYLVLDDDKPGDEACEEIATRLGRHRCRRVRLPRNDANACLQAGVLKHEVVDAFAAADDMSSESGEF